MIRVLRVIEYTYPDAETMADDMARWTLQSPPGARMSFRSAALPLEVFTSSQAPEAEPLYNLPATWQVCTACNYDNHHCGGCGAELTHTETVPGSPRYHSCFAEVDREQATFAWYERFGYTLQFPGAPKTSEAWEEMMARHGGVPDVPTT